MHRRFLVRGAVMVAMLGLGALGPRLLSLPPADHRELVEDRRHVDADHLVLGVELVARGAI